MKYLILIFLVLSGCASKEVDYQKKEISFNQCLENYLDLYNDVCAESRECDEYGGEYCTDNQADKEGSATLLIKMHHDGVKCGMDNAQTCFYRTMNGED